MSNFLERLKKDKLKSIIIGISSLVFIIGLVMTISNTGDTYATSTDSCFMCTGGSSYDSNYFWGSQPDPSTCTGSWVSIIAWNEADCLGYEVFIRYSVNGGEITTPITDINDVTHNWQSIEQNGIPVIYDGTDDYYQKIRYGGSLGTDGLVDYNNENFINITRDGYYVPSGAEWKCLSGCTTENNFFSQTEQYSSSAFCNASTSDCNVVLGVNWQPNIYTITYDANGGSGVPDNQTGTLGTTVTISTIEPTRTGYIFKWWEIETGDNEVNVSPGSSYNLDNYVSNGIVTLTAVWDADSSGEDTDSGSTTTTTYKVEYDANGGSGAPDEQTKIQGETLILSNQIPTRTGYTFLGWSRTNTNEVISYLPGSSFNIDENAKFYAVWRKNSVYIQYNVNEGTIVSTTAGGEWSTTGGLITKKDDNNVYNIFQQEFNYGGTTDSDGLVNYNNSNYINITRTGYSVPSGAEWKCLSGCTTNGKIFNQSSPYNTSEICDASNGNCTVVLKVNWTANEYTVTFNPNGGTVSQTNKTVTYNSNYGTLPTPTRKGYTFVGWYTSASGGIEITSNLPVTTASNHILYAHWRINKVNIKYHVNGGVFEETVIDENGNIIEWNTVSDIIYKNGSVYLTEIEYGKKYDLYELMSGNSSEKIYVTRDNHIPIPGKEMICIEGCESEKIYNIREKYDASEFCDATNGDCNVVLGVNWMEETSDVILDNSQDNSQDNSPPTGDVLIVIACIIGISSLGYSVYYLRSRKV